MKRLTILIGLLTISSCSDEPTWKYSNEEECNFKESRTCLDESCTVLAKDYCREAFLDSPNKLQAIQETCKRMKSEESICERGLTALTDSLGIDRKLCTAEKKNRRQRYIRNYRCD